MSRLLLYLFAISALFGQTPDIAILKAVDAQVPTAEALLERLVNQNSGTFHPAGVRAVATIMEGEL
ncbi:MAG: hypothetical protein JNM66_24555, partial [Bryobacterales bacterium]|nr:hypothetical protein [Bryobacterales bacterium]